MLTASYLCLAIQANAWNVPGGSFDAVKLWPSSGTHVAIQSRAGERAHIRLAGVRLSTRPSIQRAALEAARRWAIDTNDITYTFTFFVQAVDPDGTLAVLSRTTTYDGDTAFRQVYEFDQATWLLSQGLVKLNLSEAALLPEPRLRSYRATEALAREAQRGMWSKTSRPEAKPAR